MGARLISASQVLSGHFPGQYQLIGAMQSPNYSAGSTGWAIKGDGSAEFNMVVIRGATQQQSTVLIYNGAPANGNLILSIAPVGGTDAFGNSYPQGLAGFGNLGTINSVGVLNTRYITIQSSNTNQTIDLSPDLNTWNSGSIQTQTGNGHLTITAPQLKLDGGNGIVIDMAPASPAGGGNALLDVTADIIRVHSPVSASQPGSPATTETWHGLPYAAQWTDAGVQAGQYKLNPDGGVSLRGRARFTSNGTTGLGNPTTLCTLPAPSPNAYRPLATQGWGVPVYQSPVIATNRVPSVVIDATGVVKIFNVTSAVTNGTQVDVDLNGTFWP